MDLTSSNRNIFSFISIRLYRFSSVLALVLLSMLFGNQSFAQTVAVEGQVADRDTGLPIAGARVGDATTDADGRYTLTLDQFDNEDVTLLATSDQHFLRSGEPVFLSLLAPFPKEANFTLVQAPEWVVQGYIKDSSGSPVAGARVDIMGPSGDLTPSRTTRSAHTDASGFYVVTGSRITEDQANRGVFIDHIRVHKSGFLEPSVVFSPALESGTSYPLVIEDIFLTNATGIAVEGQVTDRDSGLPIAGALVEIVGGSGGASTTDADGRYTLTLDQFSGEDVALVASSDQTFRGGEELINLLLEAPFPKEANFTLASAPESVMQGYIRNTLGNPVKGAQVSIVARFHDQTSFPKATTDANGFYFVPGSSFTEDQVNGGVSIIGAIKVGNRHRTLGAPEFLETEELFSPALESGASYPLVIPAIDVLMLTNEVAVGGQVTDRVTGLPIAGASVGNATTDADGRYTLTLDQFTRESESLSARSGQHFESKETIRLLLEAPFPKEANFTLASAPESVMQGYIRDTLGNPVENAYVNIRVRFSSGPSVLL